MILETEILFTDDLAEKQGREPEKIWGKWSVDLREIIGVGEWIENNEIQEGLSEITIRSIGSRIIKIPYPELKKLWKKANPELKFAIN